MVLAQNLVALVNIKIVGNWVLTPLTLIIIGFDKHAYVRIISMLLNTELINYHCPGWFIMIYPYVMPKNLVFDG